MFYLDHSRLFSGHSAKSFMIATNQDSASFSVGSRIGQRRLIRQNGPLASELWRGRLWK